MFQQSEGVYRRSKHGREALSTPSTAGIHPHADERRGCGIGCITSRPSSEIEYEAWLRGITVAEVIEEQRSKHVK